MQRRQLGKTGLHVMPLAFGGNVFGWTLDEKKSFEILDAFVDAGFNFIDTADSYSTWVPDNKGGESETIIGKWMKSRANKDKVIVATKVGSDMGQGHKDLSKKYILKAAEDSLRRLQTDVIDLYQTHWDDNITPVEETLEAYAQLVRQGKVKWIGASNLSPERLKASLNAGKQLGFPLYQTFQPEYNLYARRGFETEIQPVCLENGLSVISYYSLASGFLTGKYRNEDDLGKSARGGGIKKYMNDRGFKILKALDKISADYHSTPAAIAIAWLLTRPTVAAPIASATTTEQLKALTEGAGLVLHADALQLLNEASAY
ncbi:MAG: aldo/keto reductase [Chitinophagaceae bacterium]|nr:aldo/keto reductase [Chitinophagaceae bacterium]